MQLWVISNFHILGLAERKNLYHASKTSGALAPSKTESMPHYFLRRNEIVFLSAFSDIAFSLRIIFRIFIKNIFALEENFGDSS